MLFSSVLTMTLFKKFRFIDIKTRLKHKSCRIIYNRGKKRALPAEYTKYPGLTITEWFISKQVVINCIYEWRFICYF